MTIPVIKSHLLNIFLPDNPSTSKTSKDDTFREFRRLCTLLASEPSYNAKTKIISDFVKKGTSQGTHVSLYDS